MADNNTPQAVAERIKEWIGSYGGENSATLLLYEAMNALKRTPTAIGVDLSADGIALVRHRTLDEAAEHCESRAGARGTGAWTALVAAAEGIRALKGTPAAAIALGQALTFDQWWAAGGRHLVNAAGEKRGWQGSAEASYIGGLLASGSAAVADAQPVADRFDLDAHVSIPRNLIGAACSAIDKKRDAPVVLAKLRRYTTGDLAVSAQAQPSSNPGPLVAALRLAEAALSDIGDADREPGDDVAWCERRAAQALPAVRAAIAASKEGAAS